MSRGQDMAQLTAPIELGSPTIVQLLNAKTNATAEVLTYLEQECDAILECRQCMSLFRSLANFIAHKRIYCKGSSFTRLRDLRQIYPEHETVILDPTDPDTDNLKASMSSSSASQKKRKPIRQTVPTNAVRNASGTTKVGLATIEGVSCAMRQNTESDAVSINLSDPDTVTIVHPKDGYPNMSLRQRGNRSRFDLDDDYEDIDDDEEFDDDSGDRTFMPSKAGHMSTENAARNLAKRSDCDVKSLSCLTCKSKFSTVRTLNFHMVNAHGPMRKFFPCIYCKNVFSQFWGVTRHMKRAHGMTSEGINRVREKIRARVFSRTMNGEEVLVSTNTETQASPKPSPEDGEEPSAAATTTESADGSAGDAAKTGVKMEEDSKEENNATCKMCHKTFSKRQYLLLHQVACSRKAAKGVLSKSSSHLKSNKPLLFVCKTCNRAFSMRQNMAQHAVACAKKHKLREAASSSQKKEGSEESKNKKEDKVKTNKSDKQASAATSNSNEESKADKQQEKENKQEKEAAKQTKEGKESGGGKKSSERLEDTDEILLQLSPSDEAKDKDETTIDMPTETLLQNRPKRNIKPKQFHDGTVRIPEVVKIKQADGSLVYKLREDVEASAVAPPSQLGVTFVKNAQKAASIEGDKKGLEILVQGQTVPLLGPEDEVKIERMIDAKKLVCLKCKKEYGSISNLRRHAVRHLGWRRFKCKLCKFTSYNKSECKTHLRKAHVKETSTLLDTGLHPFIIDLGALLDETCDEGLVELTLTVPSSSEESQATSAARSPKTRSKSREAAATNMETDEQNSCCSSTASQILENRSVSNSTPTALSEKKGRGRPRKNADPSAATPTGASTGTPTSESSASKQKGRPSRKHPLSTADSDTDSIAQDENVKRPRGRPKSQQSSTNDSPTKHEYERVDVKIDHTKQKDQVNKLEGLVNNLKTRTPLSGSGDSNHSPAADKPNKSDNKKVDTNNAVTATTAETK